jgi:beta-mannosidase
MPIRRHIYEIAKIDLNGTWTASSSSARTEKLEVQIPGSIHEDLLRHQLIEDPFYRDNEKQVQWIGEEDWVYERSFTIDASILSEDHIELICQGIDTISAVYINDTQVGNTDNMHCTFQFEIKKYLRSGENRIKIEIESPLKYVSTRQVLKKMPEWADSDKQNGHGQIRKMACNFGWDWGPRLTTSGIWRPIRIEARSHEKLEHFRIDQVHNDSVVELHVNTKQIFKSNTSLRITVMDPKGECLTQRIINPFHIEKLKIERPELWWPRDMGGQPLYTVQIELCNADEVVLDSQIKRIGLRRLELVQKNDEWGKSFTFEANGVPFFSKGTNMVPTSVYGTCRNAERYRTLLKFAANEHLNTIRIWGGGIYEEDIFYDLCDEMGFVVWQDFMFACSGYPLDDKDFVENVLEEAKQQLHRLVHHPCIAIWNGNNELELGWSSGWGLVGNEFIPGSFGKMDVQIYTKFFDETLRTLSEHEAPQTAYWPASPHSPVGDRKDSNSIKSGDAHIWNCLMTGEPFEYYNTCKNRFISEYGYQSLPDLETWKTCLAEGDENLNSLIVDYHQRCQHMGNTVLLLHLGRYFRLPKNFEMTCVLSQIQHGLLIKTAVEEWRRNMPRTMGAINWMLNDIWPGITNSTIDCFDRPKGSHYLHRQCMNPVLISGKVDIKHGKAEIHLTCDYHSKEYGVLQWHLMHVDGRVLLSGEEKIILPQFKTQLIKNMDIKQMLNEFGQENVLLFLEIFDGKDHLITDNVLAWCPWKHLNLQISEIVVKENNDQLVLSTDKPALWAYVPSSTSGSIYTDNFIHLRPGLNRVLSPLIQGKGSVLKPLSLRNTYS